MKHIKRILALALLAVTLLGVTLPAMAEIGIPVGSDAKVQLSSGVLNIRSLPDTTSAAKTVGNGAIVTIQGFATGTVVNGSNYWYRVVVKDPKGGTALVGYAGFAHHSYLVKDTGGSGSTGGNLTSGYYKCGSPISCVYNQTSTRFIKKITGKHFVTYNFCSIHSNCKVTERLALLSGHCPASGCGDNYEEMDMYARSTFHVNKTTGATIDQEIVYYGANVHNGLASNPLDEFTASERNKLSDYMIYPKEEFGSVVFYDTAWLPEP